MLPFQTKQFRLHCKYHKDFLNYFLFFEHLVLVSILIVIIDMIPIEDQAYNYFYKMNK